MPVLPIIELEEPKYPLPANYWYEQVEQGETMFINYEHERGGYTYNLIYLAPMKQASVEPWTEDEWEAYIERVLSLSVEETIDDSVGYLPYWVDDPRIP